MFIGDRVARQGTKNIVAAMRDANSPAHRGHELDGRQRRQALHGVEK
jgi:hypothetical protein